MSTLTFQFTITTKPKTISSRLCHRDVTVIAEDEEIAWQIVTELFSRSEHPDLVGITLTNTLV